MKKLHKLTISIAVICTLIIVIVHRRKCKTQLCQLWEEKEKYYQYYVIMSRWMKNLENGNNLSRFFEHNNYKSIAVYGLGVLGQRLLEDLRDTNIQVQYGIDQNQNISLPDNMMVYSPEDELADVDCIIVSPFWDYCRIEDLLYGKISGDIISLKEVVEYFG